MIINYSPLNNEATIINDNRFGKKVLLIDLPVVSSENGPFRLVMLTISCVNHPSVLPLHTSIAISML